MRAKYNGYSFKVDRICSGKYRVTMLKNTIAENLGVNLSNQHKEGKDRAWVVSATWGSLKSEGHKTYEEAKIIAYQMLINAVNSYQIVNGSGQTKNVDIQLVHSMKNRKFQISGCEDPEMNAKDILKMALEQNFAPPITMVVQGGNIIEIWYDSNGTEKHLTAFVK